MYMGVALLGVFSILRRPVIAALFTLFLISALAIRPHWVLYVPRVDYVYVASSVLCFLFGVLFYTNNTRIPLHGGLVMIFVAILVLVDGMRPSGNVFACLAIAYATAWTAFHPNVRVTIPKRVGDLSYGLYVYAFPVQQTLIYNFPAIGPWMLFMTASAVTAVMAWFSWHWLEKPALGLKGKFINFRPRLIRSA